MGKPDEARHQRRRRRGARGCMAAGQGRPSASACANAIGADSRIAAQCLDRPLDSLRRQQPRVVVEQEDQLRVCGGDEPIASRRWARRPTNQRARERDPSGRPAAARSAQSICRRRSEFRDEMIEERQRLDARAQGRRADPASSCRSTACASRRPPLLASAPIQIERAQRRGAPRHPGDGARVPRRQSRTNLSSDIRRTVAPAMAARIANRHS